MAQTDFIKVRDYIGTQTKEGVKSHYAYDGSARLEYAYDAPIGADNGTACLVTQYQYAILGSDRVTGRKEYVGAWDSSWDF